MRFGLMVLLVHDLSDIPIDLLKLTNYLKLEDKAGFFIVEIVFALNLCSWIYLRLYTFPVKIIWRGAIHWYSAFFNSVWMGLAPENSWVAATGAGTELSLETIRKCEALALASGHGNYFLITLATLIVGLLLILFVMHIYWFFLFMRILHGILTIGGHEA